MPVMVRFYRKYLFIKKIDVDIETNSVFPDITPFVQLAARRFKVYCDAVEAAKKKNNMTEKT